MIDIVSGALFRLLRVPPDPQVPHGEDDQVRVFRAAPTFYRYNLLRWALGQLAALSVLVLGALFVRAASGSLDRSPSFDVVFWIEVAAWVAFLVQLPLSYAALRLDYDLRWYILTPRSLRIREGLLRIREQTMTFANIQNMSIRQGPLQRLLGIADVEVHTAGGGSGRQGSGAHGSGGHGSGGRLHVGTLRGVDNAEEVRSAIQARVRLHRDAGLGDPDDPEPAVGPHLAAGSPAPTIGVPAPAANDREPAADHPEPAAEDSMLPERELLVAARTLLDEVRRLRHVV